MKPLYAISVLLTFGIVAGARAEETKHWAYRPVKRPSLPSIASGVWPQNAIDHFVLAKLEAQGISPSSEASRHQWLRRVTFDLTGLPPSLAELAALEADPRPDAYSRAVDRLLSSPRYGERMATWWLDLARYADTHGYYVDSHRDMWRYRDEVIDAFNRHQPFDQFTIEQLAGDLLPNATLSQRIASGFNRNHMINFEPGALPEEYLNEYVVDRVATTSTVWLAQTIQCAQCHDHKHDPYSMRDYYALYAFFNNVPEEGIDGRRGNAAPLITAPTREQQAQLADIAARQAQLNTALAKRASQSSADQLAWERGLSEGKGKLPEPPQDFVAAFPLDEEDGDVTRNVAFKESDSHFLAKVNGSATWLPGKFGHSLLLDGETSVDAREVCDFNADDRFTFSVWAFPTTSDRMTLLAHQAEDDSKRGYELALDDGHIVLTLSHVAPERVLRVQSKTQLRTSRWQHLAVTYSGNRRASGVAMFVDGQAIAMDVLKDELFDGDIKAKATLTIGGGETGFRGMLDEVRIYARALHPREIALVAGSNPVLQLVTVTSSKRTAEQRAQLSRFFLEHHDAEYRRLLHQRDRLDADREQVEAACPTSMVMAERDPPRETFVLERGSYQSPGEKVIAATPAVFPPLPSAAPRNRLTFARWLVDGQHPLTARVVVNRLWQLHFGEGLVRTPEDFGTQGERPTHSELLDWLAAELVGSGWDLQHIQRLILTSATYQQASMATAEQRRRDPQNRLLGYFPRRRLSAEMLRDQALSVSGLLSGTMYGPGVYPYQPPGLWEEIGVTTSEYSSQAYSPSRGADLYRRSVYTFVKRTSPSPNMSTFDASDRQTCSVARPTTNTPLQALVLLNDPTYVEAARHLAAQAIETAHADEDRMTFLFRTVVQRPPSGKESSALLRLLERQRDVYGKDAAAAEKLLAVGDSPRGTRAPSSEHAAWTCVAQALMCSDEALSSN